jgi:hypothetical protein
MSAVAIAYVTDGLSLGLEPEFWQSAPFGGPQAELRPHTQMLPA